LPIPELPPVTITVLPVIDPSFGPGIPLMACPHLVESPSDLQILTGNPSGSMVDTECSACLIFFIILT
jgi:hypothetical protein